MPNNHRNPTQEERDERVVMPLDGIDALRALLAVKPDEDEGAQGDDPADR